MQSVKPVSLGAVMLARAAAILRMNAKGLALDWLKEFDMPQITGACDRIERELPGERLTDKNIQRELIQNPDFARYLARLLPLLPKDEPVVTPPQPVYSAGCYRPSPAPRISRRTELVTRLGGLLESCREHGLDITGFGLRDLVESLEYDELTPAHRLVYLANFAPMVLSHEQRGAAVNSLRRCIDVPVELSRDQQDQLMEPYTADSCLFCHTEFGTVWEMLENCPDLRKILRLLHDYQVEEYLGLDEYTRFAENAPEYTRLLTSVADALGPDAATVFLERWQQGDCSLDELKKMERHIALHPETDWGRVLASYSGYVNEVYGRKFKNIDLSGLRYDQEDILLYAITHGKGGFIRLVDENPGMFIGLSGYSFLFQEQLYKEHLNLNELTAKDLSYCEGRRTLKLKAEHLAPGRRYSFTELRALYGVSKAYMDFYHALRSDSQDYRLRVFKEICKRDVLSGLAEDEITVLADMLDIKPLSVWKQEKFSHIDGLTPADAARLLCHIDGVQHLLSGMRNRNDAMLALRNLDSLARFSTLDEIKEHLTEVDTDWQELSGTIGLTPEFQEQYKESIVSFLGQGGAAIANSYLPCLDDSHKTAYLRVVKAGLMGKLCDLKYFEGDLHRELDAPISSRIRVGWPENLSLSGNGIEVGEHDDFFSTMLLGTQPQRTCMAYNDGVYRQCLLSAFDSNKKVLYARQDGRIVDRAFLRLTKGRMTDGSQDSGFSFVDLENVDASRGEKETGEQVVLFLERPYISGVGPEAKAEVIRQLIELAKRKSDALGVRLVLSSSYGSSDPSGFTRTRLHIFISKSKGGAQYLDSLDGEAKVDKEGSYKANTFLVRS